MSQHDYVIADQAFPATRADLNLAFQALASDNKGSTAPTTKYVGMNWLDDAATPWVLKRWDGTNWVTQYSVNASTGVVTWLGAGAFSGGVVISDATSARLTLDDTGGKSWSLSSSSDVLTFGVTGVANHLTLSSTSAIFDDTVYIGDTANSNMTQGLTINQGANDDQAFALKSSDVAHGVTGTTETDTFLQIQKGGASTGGVNIQSLGTSSVSMTLNAVAATEITTDTSSSGGTFDISAYKANGTSVTSFGATANIFTIENLITTRLLLKGNGDLHVTNTTIAALDHEDDAMLMRQLDYSASPRGIVETEWDRFVERNDTRLKELGVLSSENDFIVVQPWMKLANGAIWQQRAMFETLRKTLDEMVPGFGMKLANALTANKLPTLGAI